MEAEEFRDLLESFFEGTVDNKGYKKLFSYLAGILRRKGANNLDYDEIGEIVRDFMVKLLENRDKFLVLKDDPAGLRSYVGKSLKNFLIDYIRIRKKKKVRIQELFETDLTGKDGYESLVEKVEEQYFVRAYELAELENIFRREVETENIKYFCYLLDSKRYKCLWGEKSADAIYQDVSRKRHIVEEFGRKLRELAVSEELMRVFINMRLSKICEELRSKLCEEEK